MRKQYIGKPVFSVHWKNTILPPCPEVQVLLLSPRSTCCPSSASFLGCNQCVYKKFAIVYNKTMWEVPLCLQVLNPFDCLPFQNRVLTNISFNIMAVLIKELKDGIIFWEQCQQTQRSSAPLRMSWCWQFNCKNASWSIHKFAKNQRKRAICCLHRAY